MRAIIILYAFALSGCGAIDREKAKLFGGATETCMRGVLYYQFTSGAAIAVDVDGKPIACTP